MVTITPLDGEFWWGGTIDIGTLAPLGGSSFTCDLSRATILPSGAPCSSSQSAPILVSTRGRTLTSESPFTYQFTKTAIRVTGEAQLDHPGQGLAEAFHHAMLTHFPPTGSHPAFELLTAPQYNTWIEMPYLPTEDSVLRYVDAILAADLPPGTLMIDDNWAPDYGDWVFDARRFPHPQQMLTDLHARGFYVMLWLVPFVSPDSASFRALEKDGLLLRNGDGTTAIRSWWNGYSAILDITHPQAREWLSQRLDALIELGVDGFKYDAGDVSFYRPDDLSFGMCSPVEHMQAWAEYGQRTPFNEYRSCWKLGGRGLGQRLRDKPPQWGSEGIESLIPEVLGQAMIGHYYTCPDMIGGGELNTCSVQTTVDQEFVVRYAQIAALMPMMQFSMNPARILDTKHLQMVHDALKLRAEMMTLILRLARTASDKGIPIVRPLAFHCSDPHAAAINDQFFLGENVVIAPQVKQGASSRRVFLPSGNWVSDRGEIVRVAGCYRNSLADGGEWFEVDTPLERLAYFTRYL
ncbi:glycoside hydrolase family 31 protein [Trueperella pyogenes]|uniref:glycoside hydrolase family 31 protein n=1 Tax=Trueperella pyogenes TaxID=1661 RepID=UPI003247CBE5